MPDTPSVPDESSRLAQLTWLIALPATIAAAVLAATAGYLSNGDHTALLLLIAAAIVIVLGTAVYAVSKIRRVGDRSAELRAMAAESRSGLAQSRSELVETRAQLGDTRNELAGARAEVERLAERLRQAESAPAPMPPPGQPSGRQVEVFVNLSRRLQSLVHREIKLLDALENEVEDPDLLKGLFQVDHLATRIRRHAENLAVLGGSVSRRQWSRPVALTEVLRSAIAEVEHYSRVKLVPPIDGTLPGHAVASVVHLIAELIENATMFAPPQTQVLLRAQRVAAGVAIEVEDRGLGMQRGDQERINQLLVNPDHINLEDLLRDGRIGLYVVSVIARQHGVVVQLQTNIYGGTQAIIILPQPLLDSPTTAQQLRPAAARPESLTELTTEIPQHSSWPISPPSVTQPPMAQPPTNQPPTNQPPTNQPAVNQPPLAQPAMTQPPISQPLIPRQLPAPGADLYGAAPQPASPRMAADLPSGPFAGSPAGLSNGPAGLANGQPGLANSQPGFANGQTSFANGQSGLSGGPFLEPAVEPAVGPPRADGLPPLPRRRSQTHMVPQLQLGPPAPAPEPTGEHNPGLMASFMHGVSQGEADPAGPDRL
ncbi:ATP-binding protein [Actinoplanes sp. NPDC051343]|uniref:ATP-binding protein n=1 Tax=Actinoplanes sp. NPDC051343 TaxID=3363906 RepID=UPI003791DC94